MRPTNALPDVGQSRQQRDGAPGPAALVRRFHVSAPRQRRGGTGRAEPGTGHDEPNLCGSSGGSPRAAALRHGGPSVRWRPAQSVRREAAWVVVRRQKNVRVWLPMSHHPRGSSSRRRRYWRPAPAPRGGVVFATAGTAEPAAQTSCAQGRVGRAWCPLSESSERSSVQQTEMRNRVRIIRSGAVRGPRIKQPECRGKPADGRTKR